VYTIRFVLNFVYGLDLLEGDVLVSENIGDSELSKLTWIHACELRRAIDTTLAEL